MDVHNPPAEARFEADMHAVVLRCCPKCGAPHPGLGVNTCKCGAPLAAPQEFRTTASATVTPNRLERTVMGLGAALRRLADKI